MPCCARLKTVAIAIRGLLKHSLAVVINERNSARAGHAHPRPSASFDHRRVNASSLLSGRIAAKSLRGASENQLGIFLFQLRQPRFQRFEFLAGPAQDAGLYIEFLTRHQVELAQPGLQHGLEVFFQIATQRLHSGRHGGSKTAGEVIE
jgi:hypothetical protein